MSDYHRLSDDVVPAVHEDNTDALLWDQLNDEQSREVQQHQSRFHPPERRSRIRPWVIVQSMMWDTVCRTGNSLSSAWTAAKDAWRRYPPPRSRNNHEDGINWDEHFGIQDLSLDSHPHDEENGGHVVDEEEVQQQNGRGRPNPGYPFVVLRQYPRRQAIRQDKDHWGMVANMDVFLTSLYQFFYHRGLAPLIYKFLVEFLSLLFALWLSRILLSRLDWHKLVTCTDEHTCHANWSDYYYDHELSQTHWSVVQGYTLLFLSYIGFTVWSFWQSLQQAWNCHFIVHEKLGISRRKLHGGAVSWDEMVEKLVSAHESGEYRTTLGRLDPLVIAQRIMRKENFLIAFWNQNLLDVQIGKRHYWCPTLEWSVHVCILNHLFNHKYEIRPAFLLDATALRRRLIVCGVLHVLLLPFLILFVTFHFLLSNVYFFKTEKQYMGNKQWSTVALWAFREFNELPHVLERRLEPSYEAAENYLKLFGQSEPMAALGKLLSFVGGAVGGVLVVLGVLNDAILLNVQLWGRNLLWYAGIAAGIYSIGRSLVPTKEAQPSVTKNLFTDMDAALQSISTHTHYYPEHWKGRGWDQSVHAQFSLFFDSKVKLFLWELISLVLAPYILIVRLSSKAPEICEFCATIKAKVPGAGEVCGYSTFEFDAFKDEAWDGRTMGQSVVTNNSETPESLVESVMRTGNLEEAARNHPKPKARNGKMEKSFFSFKAAHPKWKYSPSGQTLVDRVEEYRQAELATMSRERNLYIEAAARQLETLVRLEDRGNDPLRGAWNSQHNQVAMTTSQLRAIHHNTEPADADAGSHPSPRLKPDQSPIKISQVGTTATLNTHPSIEQRSDVGSGKLDSTIIGTPDHRSVGLSVLSLNGESPLSNLDRDVMRVGLSTELHRLLSASAQGGADCVASSFHEAPMLSILQNSAMPDRTAERQHYWLERFQEHLDGEKKEINIHKSGTISVPSSAGLGNSVPMIARSMPAVLNTQNDLHLPDDSSSPTSAASHGNLP